ncbi:MAG TPA: L,D-transpeptidase [Anaerolineae bacterium]|nr:L,D-transpeptidase [Anaerolineae bacterium]
MFLRLIGMVLGLLIVATTSLVEAKPSIEQLGVLCPSRLQLRHPQLCSRGGAREELTRLAIEGYYPQRPLPTYSIDPELGNVPYFYLRSTREDGTHVYGNYQDALNEENPAWTVEPGFVFFSWIDRFDENGKIVYMITPGAYVNGDGLSRISLPNFHGVALRQTPDRPFAWVLASTRTVSEPGFGKPLTNHWVNRYETVWIYDVERVGNLDWYQIGPDEWLEQRLLAVVNPDPTVPEGVEDNRWISIDLYEQTLMVYEDGQLVYATLVSSGLKGWWTQPGVFQVYTKLDGDRMMGAFEVDRSDYYYLEDVPWTLYYDKARALHGAYWHNGFGYPRSHGCVNLSLIDAHWLFNWAEEGTWVYVFDPSGETPTDVEQYGVGGA